MAARILDGKATAKAIQEEMAAEVAAFREATGIPPTLAVLLVGEVAASQVYVRNKQAACKAAGIDSRKVALPADVSEADLTAAIDGLNADPAVHGILLQLPLPPHLKESALLERIDPLKDVDGFHPENMGRLALGRPRLVPCTPLGVQALLVRAGIDVAGKHAVVLGRSNIVGKPMGMLLLEKGPGGNATVTVAHTGTPDPAAVARRADLLVVAMGRPEAVTGDWIKPGAVVVDVGIHRRADGSLCGDVKFAEAVEVASWITPVPGGVGPMTVAMLLKNTLAAARLQAGLP